MTKLKKATLVMLALAVMCAIALVGCGSSGASSNASSSANSVGYVTANAPAHTSSSDSAAAEAQAQPYIGTWKASQLTLHVKTNANDSDNVIDIPITLELNDDMTGQISFGESTQNIKWSVRYWSSLKIERAIITLHESFQLENLECDPASLMLELSDSGSKAQLFNHWSSSAQPDVKLGIDMTMEKSL